VGVFTIYRASRPTIAVVDKMPGTEDQTTGRELYRTVTAAVEASPRRRQQVR